MKRIEAVINQDRLESVKQALAATSHGGLTISDVKELDPDGSLTLHYRNSSCAFDMLPRVSMSVLVDDDDAPAVIDAIVTAARTSRECEGTVVVVPVDEVIRITGSAAVA